MGQKPRLCLGLSFPTDTSPQRLTYIYIASEYRAWLLFYSVPVLHGILPLMYITHYALFVDAIWLLLKDKVSEGDLAKADHILLQFCQKFAELYGLLMTISIGYWPMPRLYTILGTGELFDYKLPRGAAPRLLVTKILF